MHEHGISVPDDVSVVSKGNSVLSEFVTPQLTSICRDKFEVAQGAFSLMMDRLQDPAAPIRSIKTANHLIERESVKQL